MEMETVIFGILEDDPTGKYELINEDVFRAVYDVDLVYFNKATIEEFKEKFGFAPEEFSERERKGDLDLRKYDEIIEYVRFKRKHPISVALPGLKYINAYCSRDTLIDIEKNGGIFFWGNLKSINRYPKFSLYCHFYAGDQARCYRLTEAYAIQAEFIDIEPLPKRKRKFNFNKNVVYRTERGAELVFYSSLFAVWGEKINEERTDIEAIMKEAKRL